MVWLSPTNEPSARRDIKRIAIDRRGVTSATRVRPDPVARMTASGLVEGAPDASRDRLPADERRRYYRITARGRRTLKAELIRLQSVVAIGSARGLLNAAAGRDDEATSWCAVWDRADDAPGAPASVSPGVPVRVQR